MNRAVAVPVPVYEKDNFNFTYENLKSRVTDKTKAIILNSPCNPTEALQQGKPWRPLQK